jgi:hypothetical protein
MKQTYLLKISLTIFSTIILAGCGSDSDTKTLTPFTGIAAVQTKGSGESQVEFTDGKESIESGFLAKTATDYSVFSNGEYFYQLGKFNIDTVQKYHIDSPQLGLYPNDGYILRESGTDTSVNPHNIVFLNDESNTAVITRYGHTESWVVNLDAQDFDDFIITTLDLSHHTDSITESDPNPEANMLFINDNKLFITLQNLDNYAATENAKVVVFDTATWDEVDTDSTTDGVQAISLTLKNHQSGTIFGNSIYLASLVYSDWGSEDPNTGGIEMINTDTFISTVITNELAVSKIAVDGSGKVFFSDYAAWENNTLYVLNSDNSYSQVSDDFSGINITALASPGDSIWLGSNSFDSNNDEINDNQILRLDSSLDYSQANSFDQIVLSSVETALKPIGIAFIDLEND